MVALKEFSRPHFSFSFYSNNVLLSAFDDTIFFQYDTNYSKKVEIYIIVNQFMGMANQKQKLHEKKKFKLKHIGQFPKAYY